MLIKPKNKRDSLPKWCKEARARKVIYKENASEREERRLHEDQSVLIGEAKYLKEHADKLAHTAKLAHKGIKRDRLILKSRLKNAIAKHKVFEGRTKNPTKFAFALDNLIEHGFLDWAITYLREKREDYGNGKT